MTSSDGDWSTSLPNFNRLSVSAPPSPLHSTPTETAAASATVDVMGHQQILLLRMRRPRPKRVDSSSDRLLQTIFTRHTALTEVDQEYLLAAEAGDLGAVTRAVAELNANINCVDHMGRSALELALMGDHETVVEFLLPRSNLQSIEDALLYAIGKDDVKMSELILDHPLYKNHRVQLGTADGVYQHAIDGPRMRLVTTPIVLAAQRDNFYIIQLLLMRGAKISQPHDYFCDCIECSNQRVFDSVKYSRTRLNTFRALASPAYMSLSSDDPILTAFKLSNQLELLAEIEKEYKSEYRRLSNKCKDYVVELLDLCQTSEEIVAILNEDSTGAPKEPTNSQQSTNAAPGDKDINAPTNNDEFVGLARVKLALKYEQKRFIAHATTQRQLISMWYSGMPWMRHQHILVKLLSVPLATFCLPISTIIFIAAPNSKISVMMRTPFVKFLNHTCVYVVFLILVFMAALRGGSGNPWLDMACYGVIETQPESIVYILILVWVLGMFVHECRQLWREGARDYVTDWWNWMDSALILFYLAYYGLQMVLYIKVYNSSDLNRLHICPNISHHTTCRYMTCMADRALSNITYCSGKSNCDYIDDLYSPKSRGTAFDMMSDMNQLADIFFAVANVLSFARIAHLLPANEQLGPLLVSFGRMLHDVARFAVVFILVFLAFLCGLTSLYRMHQCENRHFSSVDLTLKSLFWATFGMGDTRAPLFDKRHLSLDEPLIDSHSTHHPLTITVGYGLLWFYIAGTVVVLLNMLIAMMSNSFQEIYDDRDVEWKFARAKLWSDFFESGCTLPTPFNLIPNPKFFIGIGRWLLNKRRKHHEDPPVEMAYTRRNGMTNEKIAHIEIEGGAESLYQRVTRRLVQRFIYKKQNEEADKLSGDNEMDELKHDIGNICSSVEKLRHEVMYLHGRLPSSSARGSFSPNDRDSGCLHTEMDI